MSVEKYTIEVWQKEELPYTMIPNQVVQNMTHEPEALMVWIYLLTLPSDWEINRKFIMNKFGWGRDKVNKCLSTLRQYTLLEYTQERVEEGKFSKLIIKILNGTRFNANRYTENPITGKSTATLKRPVTGVQDPTNNNINNKDKAYTNKTERRNKKDFLKTEESFVLPTQVNEELWIDFLQHRKDMKSPMSLVAQKRACNALDKFIKEGHDVNAIIEQSIVNGWKGLFTIKSMENGYGKYNGSNGRNGEKEFDLGEALRKGRGDHPGFLLNPNL